MTALTGSIGLYFFRTNEKLTFYAAPTLLVCIFAFFVAHCILSLYEVIVLLINKQKTNQLNFRWSWIRCIFACVRIRKTHQRKFKLKIWG